MQPWLVGIARLAGGLGVVVSVAAGLVRLSGSYEMGGFQLVTLLQVGIAAMVAGCLAYLASMADPAGR